jgi:hypothetical protein
MNDIERLLSTYEVDVDFPAVSGMEHLQMLMTRSQLYEHERQLSAAQKRRLRAADQKLLKQASLFSEAVQSIADLSQWRQMQAITAEQWWWYLDVLAQLPEGAVVSSAREEMPQKENT